MDVYFLIDESPKVFYQVTCAENENFLLLNLNLVKSKCSHSLYIKDCNENSVALDDCLSLVYLVVPRDPDTKLFLLKNRITSVEEMYFLQFSDREFSKKIELVECLMHFRGHLLHTIFRKIHIPLMRNIAQNDSVIEICSSEESLAPFVGRLLKNDVRLVTVFTRPELAEKTREMKSSNGQSFIIDTAVPCNVPNLVHTEKGFIITNDSTLTRVSTIPSIVFCSRYRINASVLILNCENLFFFAKDSFECILPNVQRVVSIWKSDDQEQYRDTLKYFYSNNFILCCSVKLETQSESISQVDIFARLPESKT